jgi:hypothetical protein
MDALQGGLTKCSGLNIYRIRSRKQLDQKGEDTETGKETTVAQADPKTEGLEIQLDGRIEAVP